MVDGSANGAMMDQDPAVRRELYSGWTSFGVLEEIATPFLVADFSPGQHRIFWANDPALKLHWGTLEALEGFNSDQRNFAIAGLEDEEIHQNVQVRFRIHHAMKTVVLNGVQRQLRWTCRPCRVQVAEDSIRDLALISFKPLENTIDPLAADALLSFSGVISTMFEYGPDTTKYAIYQNEKARSFYRDFRYLGQEITQHRKRVLCLQEVLDSCQWSDSSEQEEMTSRLRSLTADDGEISFSCRRTRAGSREDDETWHRMCFRCVTSPFTSDTVVLLNEYDVTAEVLRAGSTSALQEDSRAVSAVLADVSGELRTPLNGIIGLSESLLQDPRCSVQMQRSLTAIKEGGLRLEQLVRECARGGGGGEGGGGQLCALCGNRECEVSEMEAAERRGRAEEGSGLGLGLGSISEEGVEGCVESAPEEVTRLVEENAALQQEVAELQERLEAARAELEEGVERARRDAEAASREAEAHGGGGLLGGGEGELAERLMELQDQLAGAQQVVEEVEKTQEEAKRLRETNEDLEERVVELHGRLVEAGLQMQEEGREKLLLSTKVKEREEELQRLRAEQQERGGEAEGGEAAALREEVEQLQAQREAAERRAEAEAKARRVAEEDCREVQQGLAEAIGQVTALEQAAAELRQAGGREGSVAAQLESTVGELARSEDETRELRGRLEARLEEEAAACDFLDEQVQGLEEAAAAMSAAAEERVAELEQSNAQLEERAAALEGMLETAKAAMEEELQELDRTREQVGVLEKSKTEAAEQRICALEAELGSSAEELRRAQEEARKLREEVVAKAEEAAATAQREKTAKRQLEELERGGSARASEVTERVAELEQSNAQLEERAAALEGMLETAKAAMEEELQELDRTREQVGVLEKSKTEGEVLSARLEETVEKQQREIVQLMEEMGNTSGENQRLKLENDELWEEIETRSQKGEDDEEAREQLAKQLVEVREELGGVEAKRAAAKLENARLQRQIDELQTELEAAAQWAEEAEALRQEGKAKEERLQEAERARVEQEAARQEAGRRLERMQEENRQLQLHNVDLVGIVRKKSNNGGGQAQQEISRLQAEVEEARNKAGALEEERDALCRGAARLALVEGELAQAVSSRSALEEERAGLQAQLREAGQAAEAKKAEADAAMEQLRRELKVAGEEKAMLKEEAERGREKEERAAAAGEDAGRSVAKLEQALKAAREELKGTDSERAASRAELAALERRVEEGQREVEAAVRAKEEAVRELEVLKAEMAALRKQAAEMKGVQAEEKGEVARLREELAAVRREVERWEAEADARRRAGAKAEEEAEQLREQNEAMEQKVQELEAEAADAMQAIEDVALWKEKVEQLQVELSKAAEQRVTALGATVSAAEGDSAPSTTTAMQGPAGVDHAAASQKDVDGRWPMHCDVFGSYEVMSVDDTSVNHMVVESALKPRGLRVTVCLSGEEALEKIEKRGYLPDCMLVDCVMPGGMDGFETCRKIRELYPSNALPIIMVSGKGQEQDVTDSHEAGCSDYVTKPFTVAELNEHVDVQLKMKQVWMLEVQRLLVSRSVPTDFEEEEEEEERSLMPKVHAGATVLVCNLVGLGQSAWAMPGAQFASMYGAVLDSFEAVIAEEEGVECAVDECFVAFIPGTERGAQANAEQILRVAKRLLEEAQLAAVSEALRGQQGVRVQIGLAVGDVVEATVGIRARFTTFSGTGVRDAWAALLQVQHGCIAATEGVREALGGVEELLLCSEAEDTGGEPLRTYVAKHGRFERCLERGERVEGAEDSFEEEAEEAEAEPRWSCNMRSFTAPPPPERTRRRPAEPLRRRQPPQEFSRRKAAAEAAAEEDSETPAGCSRCVDLQRELEEHRSREPQAAPEEPARPPAVHQDVQTEPAALPASQPHGSPAACSVCAQRRAEAVQEARGHASTPTRAMPSREEPHGSGVPREEEGGGAGSEASGSTPASGRRGRMRIRDGVRHALGPHLLMQAEMHTRELQLREALHQRERNAVHGLAHSLLQDMDALRATPLLSRLGADIATRTPDPPAPNAGSAAPSSGV